MSLSSRLLTTESLSEAAAPLVLSPGGDGSAPPLPDTSFRVATYNVHRWTGVRGGRAWKPERAAHVIASLDADVLALQEVLRPFDGPQPLDRLAEDLGYHIAFVPARVHRQGVLGNAILARWPMDVFAIDLNFGRFEQRSAVAARFEGLGPRQAMSFSVVATHLALVDRTRHRQVEALLSHPWLDGSVVLLGDMNAWRRCRATRNLESEFMHRHHNDQWPASFPAVRPVLALDRIYARGARVENLSAINGPVARTASDHLPLMATIRLEDV